MRLRMIALCLLLSLLLSACSSVLNRSYSAQSPHNQFVDEEKETNVLRADTYQSLISALLYLISNGEESGVIRLYDYGDSAEQDLDAACLELTRQDPLGAYAVDYMKYDMARLPDYSEVDLKIVYQRTWQQISAVSSVTSSSAVVGELRAALLDFQKEKVLRVSYFDPSIQADRVVAMVEEAYYDVPEASFGLPTATVSLYPEKPVGQQRLVEILLEYPQPREVLKEQQAKLLKECELLLKPIANKTPQETVQSVVTILKKQVKLQALGDSSAYAALVDGAANMEGLTLAAELLLQKSGLQCRMVRGTKNAVPQQWVVVQVDDVWSHLDLTAQSPRPAGDRAMQAAGYRWTSDLPLCQDVDPKS